MEIIINRSIKSSGLMERARTFYLLLNDKGPYLIYLGRPTQNPKQTNDFLVNAIADKAINPPK